MFKKTSFTELLYLSLLFTALRPPDNHLFRGSERPYWQSPGDSIGLLIAESFNYGPNRLRDTIGPFGNDYLNSKSNILLRETLEVLEDLNSLGRYAGPPQHNAHLIAYPVSARSNDSGSFEVRGRPILDDDHSLTDLPSPLFDDLEANTLSAINLNDYSFNDDDELIVENDEPSDQRHDEDPINVDDLMLDSSVMFPTFDNSTDDVNDLFGELELLLSNETEDYGQDWPNTSFFPAATAASASTTSSATPTVDSAEYTVYDAPSGTNLDSCNIYEPASSNVATNSTGSYSNNFGAVLYSSLTALSNGNDNGINQELSSSNLVQQYNSTDLSDLAYMSNVSLNNITNSDCFYGSYLPEDGFNVNSVNSSGGQFAYQASGASSEVHSDFVSPAQPIAQFPTQTATEDCFDKSSDSAVSSMSSDRVPSYSDNDWVETSSESSSYNGEINLSEYSNENKSNNLSAQKKYRLFGKNKNGDLKNASQANGNYYTVDYSQMNYAYPNGGSAGSFESNENYNQINYYTAVNHNHTYAQPTEVTPLGSMSSNTPTNDWSSNESVQNLNENKKPESTRSSSKSQKQRDNENAQRDAHLNRDEKRARTLKIPISTHDIINLPIDEFNERLTKFELTEIQLSLIRDIRRRGKNKVAAQNCRKRKLDQIMCLQSEVGRMFSQKSSLENRYNQLMILREMARDKYTKLYQFVVESSSSQQPFFESSASPPDFPEKDSNTTNDVQIGSNAGNTFLVTSNNTSSPVHVSSFGVQGEFKQE